jgi:hypothetical protein
MIMYNIIKHMYVDYNYIIFNIWHVIINMLQNIITKM